jgi:phosphoribosylformimino-5-aminoimidazole carboxamide ribonucleotide (ProFAR) isomerase
MTVRRDETLHPVKDFIKNIRPHIKDNTIATEVYKDGLLIGWNIEQLIK